MTTYKPEGFMPEASTDIFCFEHTEKDSGIWLNVKNPFLKGVRNHYQIDKDYALQAVCQAYLGDKTTNLTEREALIAWLAGYDIEDREGDGTIESGPPRMGPIEYWGDRDLSPYKITQPTPQPVKPVERLNYKDIPKYDDAGLYFEGKINELVDVVNKLVELEQDNKGKTND